MSSTRILVVEYFISLPHAVRMMKALRAKKHAKLGFYFDLKEIGIIARTVKNEELLFSEYHPGTELYLFKVYRDKA